MGTWKTPAQVPLAPPLRQGGELDPQTIRAMYEYVKKMANVLSSLRNDLEFMINGNLDVQNVRAQGIETRNLKSGSVTTDILAAGAVVADKIDVDRLSAISADLGTINAGRITTDAEIDVGTNATIGNILYLNPTDSTDDKGIVFKNTGVEISVIGSDVSINTPGDIYLSAGGDAYANGGRIATQGISVSIDVMGADGITPVTLEFNDGVLVDVD